MPEQSTLPNTENINVIESAIAWELVKISFSRYSPNEPIDSYIHHMTNEYLKVIEAIHSGKSIAN